LNPFPEVPINEAAQKKPLRRVTLNAVSKLKDAAAMQTGRLENGLCQFVTEPIF
jgi:hypothetical protein